MIVSILKKTVRILRINDIVCSVLSPINKIIIDGDTNEAKRQLLAYCKDPEGTSFGANTIKRFPKYDLQIIIPVYNVEKYIVQCLESIKKQKTEYKYKVVIVDDGSKDKSGEIIDTYVAENWEVIHKSNGGLSSARNNGLKTIDANYIMFLDSDDYLPEGAIQNMLKVAYQYDADLIQGGSYRLSRDGKLSVHSKFSKLRPMKDLMEVQGFAWGKIYKNTLFNNVIFPVGYLFEDTMISFIIVPVIKKGFCVPSMIYVYRDNSTGISNTYKNNPRLVESYWITERMVNENKQRNIPENVFYREMLFRQIVCNCKRALSLPDGIQKAIFILSCKLLDNQGFTEHDFKRHKFLYRALKNHDYGNYLMYCKTR